MDSGWRSGPTRRATRATCAPGGSRATRRWSPWVVDQYPAAHLSLSPDGRWLAYTSERTGRKEVYVTPFPSVASTHLVSREGGNEPRWSRDGRELFFKGPTQLMAVPITPDGQHFVMIRELGGDAPPGVIYAEHWLGDLEARVRARR
jgi:Tol biopolymer transport system component